MLAHSPNGSLSGSQVTEHYSGEQAFVSIGTVDLYRGSSPGGISGGGKYIISTFFSLHFSNPAYSGPASPRVRRRSRLSENPIVAVVIDAHAVPRTPLLGAT